MRLLVFGTFAAIVMAAACTGAAIVVGDDTDVPPSPPDPIVDPDADLVDAAGEDAPPVKVPPHDSGASDDAQSDASCPTLSPPAPGFCDGASPVPKYDSNACIVGYGCAPLDCTTAGGTCVGLAPGSCPGNKLGDATKYACGSGIGAACCLP